MMKRRDVGRNSFAQIIVGHEPFGAAAEAIAHALRGLGVDHGDRILSWTDTSLDALPLFAAAAKLGAIFAPLNARLGVAEATELTRFARPRVFAADDVHAAAAEAVAAATDVRDLVRLGAGVVEVAHATGQGDTLAFAAPVTESLSPRFAASRSTLESG